MTRVHMFATLLSMLTGLHIADAQDLSLPQSGGENAITDSFNMRNDLASSIIADYSSYDYIAVGNFDSIVVEHDGSGKNSLFDHQIGVARLAGLGATINPLTSNSFELQISSQPVTPPDFDTDDSELFRERVKELVDILDADERVVNWYPNYRVGIH